MRISTWTEVPPAFNCLELDGRAVDRRSHDHSIILSLTWKTPGRCVERFGFAENTELVYAPTLFCDEFASRGGSSASSSGIRSALLPKQYIFFVDQTHGLKEAECWLEVTMFFQIASPTDGVAVHLSGRQSVDRQPYPEVTLS
jgi:hypothetical protein